MMDLNRYSAQQEEVRSFYGKTKSDIDTDLDILKEWIKKRPHLPIHLIKEDGFLERLLLKNKFSIAKTKLKIECYCSRRTNYGFLFEGYDEIIPSKQPAMLFAPYELTEKLERIILSKILDEDAYDYKADVLQAILGMELFMRFDYSVGTIVIFDLSQTTSKILAKCQLKLSVPTYNLLLNAYSEKIAEVHVVHEFAPTFKSLIKPFLSKKLFNKIICHDNMVSLLKVVPAKYLPEECGGEYESVNEIQLAWSETLVKYRDLIEHALNTVSNEELRIDDPNDPSIIGTFRRLSFD